MLGQAGIPCLSSDVPCVNAGATAAVTVPIMVPVVLVGSVGFANSVLIGASLFQTRKVYDQVQVRHHFDDCEENSIEMAFV